MRLLGVILAIMFIALSSIFGKKFNYQNQKLRTELLNNHHFTRT